MKILIAILISVLIIQTGFSQQKRDNAIIVKGVSFTDVCNKLLDSGYLILKKDNDLQTAQTEYRSVPKTKLYLKHFISIRVKDSVATLTGLWYNEGIIGTRFLGQDQTIENSTSPIENRPGQYKIVFAQMKSVALSFGKPVEYARF